MAILDVGTSDVFSRSAYACVNDTILMIGLNLDYTGDLAALGLRRNSTLIFGDLGALRAEALLQLAPHSVMCPLIGEGFDAVDIAQKLNDLGYEGTLNVLCLPLSCADMIHAELREVAPNLTTAIRHLKPLQKALKP